MENKKNSFRKPEPFNPRFQSKKVVLVSHKQTIEFDSFEQLDLYVSRFKETMPNVDLSDAKVFIVKIFSTTKSF